MAVEAYPGAYNPHSVDMEDGYDSEEDFIDDTQFEDPEGYVDNITEEGEGNFYEEYSKNYCEMLICNFNSITHTKFVKGA